MRRSNARRRSGGNRRNRPRWTALVDTYVLAAGSIDESIVVAPSDYTTAAALENDATFLRLRGSLQITNTSVTLASTVVCALMALNQNVGIADPANQAFLQNGNVLWSQIVTLQPQIAASSGIGASFRWENIDVKSKRKLSSEYEGHRITMVISNVAGGGAIGVAFLARALISLKL